MTKVSYEQSKLGNQHFLSGSRVGVVFTYALTQEDADTVSSTSLSTANNGVLSNAYTGKGTVSGKVLGTLAGLKEVVIGAGIRSLTVEQRINVEQIGALGYFDIVETIDHNVQGNTMSIDKMALRARLLSSLGIAPWGKDVLTSPAINAYVLDVKERQRGVDLGFVKCYGLHIESNRFGSSLGQAGSESVSFKATTIRRVGKLPAGLLAGLKAVSPTIYSGVETLSDFDIEDEY